VGLLLLVRPDPGVAAGLVLLTATPGGGISNVISYLAGANVALSVTLTAVSSLLTVVTLPLLTSLGFEHFVGEAGAVRVPVGSLIGQLAGLILLPIALGMRLRARRPQLPQRLGPWLRRAVLLAIVLLFAAGMGGDDTGLAGEVLANAWLGLVWTLLAMAVGVTTAVTLRLDGPERFTFLVEFSVKNVGLAAILALASFDRPAFAIFPGAYAMTGYPLAIGLALLFKRLRG
jgi:BASS family bile acid:Na+ symporter